MKLNNDAAGDLRNARARADALDQKEIGQMPDTVVCVGAVVRKRGRVLLVRQAAGHPLAGQWTIPWGRIDDPTNPFFPSIGFL